MNKNEKHIFEDMQDKFTKRRNCLFYYLPNNKDSIKLVNALVNWDYHLFPNPKEQERDLYKIFKYAEKNDKIRLPFRFLYDYLWDISV